MTYLFYHLFAAVFTLAFIIGCDYKLGKWWGYIFLAIICLIVGYVALPVLIGYWLALSIKEKTKE